MRSNTILLCYTDKKSYTLFTNELNSISLASFLRSSLSEEKGEQHHIIISWLDKFPHQDNMLWNFPNRE